MKKCLIGFIVVLTMILGINNVSALIGSDNNEYPSKPNDEYNNYFIYYTDTNCSDCGMPRYKGYYLVSYSDIGTYVASSYMSSSNYGTEINVFKAPPFRTIIPGESPGLGSPNNDVPFKRYRLINNEWKNDLSSDTDLRFSSVYKMIYSTKDIYYRYDVAQSTYPSGNGFIPGTYRVTINGLEGAYQFKTYNSDTKREINITKSHANDLNNNDIYIIRSDFSRVYDQNYKYQIKTNYTDWIDISSDIHSKALEGYYFNDYTTYYNVNFQTRVLDNNNNILYEGSIDVTELNNFGMNITHAAAEDLEGRYINTITVDLMNCWDDSYTYQYSYDNKKFYNIAVTNETKKFWLNHGIQTFLYFRILDSNNNVIYNKDYEEIFDGLIKHIQIKEDTKLTEDNKKYIILNIIFNNYSQFYDTYNLKFMINDRVLTGSTGAYIYELSKNDYENFNEIEIKVYVDDFLVESVCYSPKYGDISFDDKYDDIIEDKLEEELGNQDFSNVENMIKTIQNFLNSIKDIVLTFFKLIMKFFNNLNIWIKSSIIGLFITMVICKIIKAVRK